MSSNSGNGTEAESEASLNRSCEPCRSAKVRCQFEGDGVGPKCQRCQLTNRSCVFVARLPRKPRKRTDTRIKELEQKLQAMENSLLKPPIPTPAHTLSIADGSSPASRNSRTSLGSRTRKEAIPIETPGSTYGENRRRSSTRQYEEADPGSDAGSSEAPQDAVTRGLISPADAEELFNRWINHYMAEYPLVVFPAGTLSDDIRISRPTLFLAIIAAASGSSEQNLFRALNVELLREFAEKIVICSLKDLELVQAMLVMAAWYFPPDRFEELKHYQYIHMAATMAMDIGLGEVLSTSGPSTDRPRALSHGSPASIVEADAVEVERYRTILSCYLLCAG